MPCGDSGQSDYNCGYDVGFREGSKGKAIHHPDDKESIILLQNDKVKLEGHLCAIITELEKLGIANEVITRAAKNGQTDLMNWWVTHSTEDWVKLADKLRRTFSEHEQEVIKKLLNQTDFK